MVTTIGKPFFDRELSHLTLQPLSRLVDIEGAGGQSVPYLGYIEVEVKLQSSTGESEGIAVPAFVVPPSRSNRIVPVIIGTNFLTALRARNTPFHDAAILEALAHLDQSEVTEQEVAVYSCRHTVIPANTSIIVKGRMGAQKGFSAGMLQPAETLPGGILIPASVVQADNNHRVDVVLTNVSCREMKIPKRQKIATMTNSVILDRDKTVGDLTHSDVLSNGDCGKGTKGEVLVNLDATKLSEEQKKTVQALCHDFGDIFASRTMEQSKAVGVKHKIRLTYETPF